MSCQNVSITRINKKFPFCLTLRNFRQMLQEAEKPPTAKAIPTATFHTGPVVDANGQKCAKVRVTLTVAIARKSDKSGIHVDVSFATNTTFFCSSIFRLVSNNSEEILHSPKRNFRPICSATKASHVFQVSLKSPNCICIPSNDGQPVMHKGRQCYDYIPDFETDTLKVLLDLEVYWDETTTACSAADVSGPTAHDDIKNLLLDEQFADVTVVCEEKTFHTFKFLLAARSQVFKAMLTGDTKEAKSSRIEVKGDVRHEMMAILFQFLATDEVAEDELKEHAMELLAVADLFDVKRLRSVCENFVGNGVDAQNCAECLILAERYKSLEIKSKAIEAIREKKNEVLLTTGWKMLVQQQPDVVTEILSNVL